MVNKRGGVGGRGGLPFPKQVGAIFSKMGCNATFLKMCEGGYIILTMWNGGRGGGGRSCIFLLIKKEREDSFCPCLLNSVEFVSGVAGRY